MALVVDKVVDWSKYDKVVSIRIPDEMLVDLKKVRKSLKMEGIETEGRGVSATIKYLVQRGIDDYLNR